MTMNHFQGSLKVPPWLRLYNKRCIINNHLYCLMSLMVAQMILMYIIVYIYIILYIVLFVLGKKGFVHGTSITSTQTPNQAQV